MYEYEGRTDNSRQRKEMAVVDTYFRKREEHSKDGRLRLKSKEGEKDGKES